MSPFDVELLLGVNLIAHCITSLIVGNLRDKFGRKPIIIIGLIIFIFGSLLCVCGTEYWYLLVGRFLQGVGTWSGSFSIYINIYSYSIKKQQQLMGIINGVITLAMAFASVIGSYVNLFFNWRGNFVVLLLI